MQKELPETQNVERRQAILVLGMHRSGTSALAGVLARLGARTPKSVLPPKDDNPRGFFESQELMGFHSRLLESVDGRWDDWEPFDSNWLDSAVAGDYLEELSGLIAREYGRSKLILIKDPRICRLVPIWLLALERLRIAPRVILIFRNPIEVARSLQIRNGFGPHRSSLIWLRHLLDAESDTQSVPRCFVSYEGLLSDWRGVIERVTNDLEITWGKRSAAREKDIDQFLTHRLRHHVVDDKTLEADQDVIDWVKDSYRTVDRLSRGIGSSKTAERTLSRVRIEFARASCVFRGMMREEEDRLRLVQDRLKEQSEIIPRLKDKLAEVVAALEKREARFEKALLEEKERLEQAIEREGLLRQDLDRERDFLASQKIKAAESDSELISQREKTAEAESKLDSQQVKISSQDSKLISEREKITQLDSKLASQREKVTQLDSKLASQREKVTQLESGLASQREKVAQLESGLASQREKVTQLESRLASQREMVAQLESRLKTQGGKVAEQESELAARRKELKTLKAREKQIAESLEQTRTTLARKEGSLERLESENRRLETTSLEQAKSLETRSDEYAEISRSLIAQTREAEQLRASVRELQESLSSLSRELDQKDAELTEKGEAVVAMKRSASWRMTAPFRWISGKWRGNHPANRIDSKEIESMRKSELSDA